MISNNSCFTIPKTVGNIQGGLPSAFLPESLRYCIFWKQHVFWLSPIGNRLPAPKPGAVAIDVTNMKGLQLRVQLRFFTGFHHFFHCKSNQFLFIRLLKLEETRDSKWLRLVSAYTLKPNKCFYR